MTDVIVGQRVEDTKYRPYPGSRKFDCSGCGRPTWLAPAGQKVAARGGVVVCQVCGERIMPAADSVGPAPGAMAEVAAWLRRN